MKQKAVAVGEERRSLFFNIYYTLSFIVKRRKHVYITRRR
jgi:hypothetical protein